MDPEEEFEPVTDQVLDLLLTDLRSAGFAAIDKNAVATYLGALLSKQFLILSGLSGSGKTQIAIGVAGWLTRGGAGSHASLQFETGCRIPSDRIEYVVGTVGTTAVELISENGQSVTLGFDLIREWVDVIKANEFDRSTTPRKIRDLVSAESKISGQLHSFETQLKSVAFWILEHNPTSVASTAVVVQPVGAGWSSKEDLVGYPDALDSTRYIGTRILDLVLDASANQEEPYFLILDEMNLAHVERYFADFLSVIESDGVIDFHSDESRLTASGKAVPNRIRLPRNLFIVGTINVDETTYQFSPKVLDRAQVIEFRVGAKDYKQFLSGDVCKPRVSDLYGRGAVYGRDFVGRSKSELAQKANKTLSLEGESGQKFRRELQLWFEILSSRNLEFGYRIGREAERFVAFFALLTGKKPSNPIAGESSKAETSRWFNEAFDGVIVQKILPKLNGSRSKLDPLLFELQQACFLDLGDKNDVSDLVAKVHERKIDPPDDGISGARYPKSAEKIQRMIRMLDSGFASFAEA